MTATSAPPQSGTAPSPANIQLMQLTSAYWASRCLHVVAQLGVADHIGDTPQSTEALAKATNPQALEMNFKGIFLDEGRRILG